MAKQTVVEEVKARMQEMQQKKAGELETVRQRQQEAQTQKEAAELAIREATDSMDLDAYEEAKTAKRKAQTAIDMYTGKYNQISKQEYISEAESDKVIDSLLAYEDELAAGFKASVAEPLKKLDELQKAYADAVEDVEQTIRAWTGNIHANYRNTGTTYADGTNRSPQPVPVRRLPYTGCSEAHQLKDYLDKAAGLY
jgi:hypothetical protein